MTRLNIKQVADAALNRIDAVLDRWVPNGEYKGAEYVALNPTRSDRTPGSFSINRNTGAWSDFASNDKGGDLVSLVAYIEGINNGKACGILADFLGINCAGSEQQSSGRNAPAKKEFWAPVMPVPEAAAKTAPQKHFKNGSPSAEWIYLDETGALLMKVMRFDVRKNGQREKDYRPLTYCVDTRGKYEWRWQQPKDSRPLYGLDSLARAPGAEVVVVEGEKAADAARKLFPARVAVTWPGGSNALTKADFGPLAGREVILWPDNDSAGVKCMAKLAGILAKLGCPVKHIDLKAFGPKWSTKADAADAEKHGVNAEALARLERSGNLFVTAKKPNSRESGKHKNSSAQSGFVVKSSGVFYQSPDEDGEGRLVRVCDRLDIVALTRDKQGGNWGMLVRFSDPDGAAKDWNIPSELLATEGGAEMLRQLLSLGLRIESRQQSRRKLIEYLHAKQKELTERYTLVNKLGWHGKAYLLPGTTLGMPKEPLYFYSQVPDLNKVDRLGELGDWQKNVAAYCIGNPLLTFSVSAAFAGPLLHLVGMESTGFHFYGDSSQGKTTLLKVAASVYGPPDYVRTWRSTDNALESIAAAHSDGLLILDEISQCDPRVVGEITYMLGNGKGKARANDRGSVRSNAFEWRLLFLSTGERTLEQQMDEAGKKVKAGQEARLLAIPSDAGGNRGIFNDLHSFAGGAIFSKFLVGNAEKAYGSAIFAFLEKLCNSNLDKLATRIRDKMIAFSHRVPESASGQVKRAADKFALVGFAGELASRSGITGWPEGCAESAALTCFNRWISARGGLGSLEDQQILSQIKRFFERNGEGSFTRLDNDGATVDDHGVRTMNRCGFRKLAKDGEDPDMSETIYYVLPESFKQEVCQALNIKRAKELLAECGALERDSQGNYSVPIRLPGFGRGQRRVYIVRPHLIPDMCEEGADEGKAA